jgi:hypothetical protein
MKSLLRISVLVAASVLGGCAVVSKVETGEAVIKDKLAVQVVTPWNKFNRGMGDNTPTWTVEGIAVDALQFYVGVKNDELLAPTPTDRKGVEPVAFKSNMQPSEVVALYQKLFTRDGSSFTLNKIEPTDFIGMRGFRFEYAMVRKVDDVRLSGVAYGAVRNGELFLINYTAPRLAFFPKHIQQVEALVKSARVKG